MVTFFSISRSNTTLQSFAKFTQYSGTLYITKIDNVRRKKSSLY
jgi:hypothetical protein